MSTYLSPAKVNLWLRILGCREDGFHEIETRMCPVDIYDQVTVTPKEAGIRITCFRSGASNRERQPCLESRRGVLPGNRICRRCSHPSGQKDSLGSRTGGRKRKRSNCSKCSQCELRGPAQSRKARRSCCVNRIGCRLFPQWRRLRLSGAGRSGHARSRTHAISSSAPDQASFRCLHTVGLPKVEGIEGTARNQLCTSGNAVGHHEQRP